MDNVGVALQELFDEQTAELLQDVDRSEPHIFSKRHEKKMQKLFKSAPISKILTARPSTGI